MMPRKAAAMPSRSARTDTLGTPINEPGGKKRCYLMRRRLSTSELTQLFKFGQQSMTKWTLWAKLIEQCLCPINRFRIVAVFPEDLPVATLDFCFGKQNTLLGD